MSYFKAIRKLVFHSSIFVLLIGLILASSVLIFKFGPPKVKYYDNSWDNEEPFVPVTNITYNVLFDQHSHTKYSDGRLTTRQNIEWHIALGFTAVAITDHNTLRNSKEIAELAEEYKDEIIVLQGMEWTTRRVHLNFIGISEWSLKIPRSPSDTEIQDAILEVHNQGGIVTVNHIPFTEKTVGDITPSREELLSWGVDFIEIINGMDFDETSYQFCLENNETIGMITGTDFHSPDASEGGRVFAWTALNTENFSENAVMNELKIHNTSIIVNQLGIENHGIHDRSKIYNVLSPFYTLGEGLVYYYLRYDRVHGSFERVIVTVFVSYSVGIFLIFEFIINVRNKIKLKRK